MRLIKHTRGYRVRPYDHAPHFTSTEKIAQDEMVTAVCGTTLELFRPCSPLPRARARVIYISLPGCRYRRPSRLPGRPNKSPINMSWLKSPLVISYLAEQELRALILTYGQHFSTIKCDLSLVNKVCQGWQRSDASLRYGGQDIIS